MFIINSSSRLFVNLVRRQVTSEELDHMLDTQETSLFVDNVNI